MPTDEKILTENATPGASGTRIAKDKYDAMRRAILAVVPRRAEGIPWREAAEEVGPRLPRRLFEGASVRWYFTVVKLDLEARGLIERVPRKRPQRIRRAR